MKANTRITAAEIVSSVLTPDSKFKKLEDIFGKVRVRIAGIAGIVSAEHIVNIPAGVEKIEVIVGDETYELTTEGDNEEKAQTTRATEALAATGAEIAQKQATEAAQAQGEQAQPEAAQG